MTTLGALLEDVGLDVAVDTAASQLEVSTVELDSRRCVPGSVFVAVPGRTTTGVAHAADALARGAICVVATEPVPDAPVAVVVPDADLRGVLAALASTIAGNPAEQLTLVGVTGTDGKTTTAWLVAGILDATGSHAESIGTLSGQHTTPDAPELHRTLRGVVDRAAARGRTGAVALEVSSHALDQGRVDAIRFDVAVFTNLSRDHLDYHETMEAYFAAKATLFDASRAALAVICIDDEWGRRLVELCDVPVVEVSSSDASDVAIDIGRTTFTWRGRGVATRLTGTFNVTDAILALSAVESLGVSVDAAIEALSDVPAVPGRLGLVGSGDPAVLVDYAHTPAALGRALRDLRAVRPDSRLVVVFGCGGDRDAGKRPLMGEVASSIADEVVLTSDNPRSEDPDAIIDAIAAGATGPALLRRDVDRVSAITSAIASASSSDVVLLAGKGHERTQEVRGQFFDLDDAAVASEALHARSVSC